MILEDIIIYYMSLFDIYTYLYIYIYIYLNIYIYIYVLCFPLFSLYILIFFDVDVWIYMAIHGYQDMQHPSAVHQPEQEGSEAKKTRRHQHVGSRNLWKNMEE